VTTVASELPYARGELLRSTADDVAKLRAAWRIVARRHAEGTLHDFTGLVRSMPPPEGPLDDELAPALYGERLTALGLEHLGGVAGRDDVFVANRTTAGIVAAMQVLVPPGGRVVGVSAGYSHPAVRRAVALAGGTLDDRRELDGPLDADLLVLTRLAVTYEALTAEQIERAVELAGDVPVFVDDAGGARVGPAVLGQPRTLELGPVAGVTGLDKYGTAGPRLGLVGGRAEIVASIRARAIELGLEARPMLYPAVVASLEQYRPERVRQLVETTAELARELPDWAVRTPVAVKLEGEDILAAIGAQDGSLVPIEATAGLAMLLLRDHGILTVHFAALPPGTSALLLKFMPPETLARFGGARAFADAVDASLEELARVVAAGELRALLGL
jgi:L-seryl-tRNA(Ser) seleniumtransferase